MRPCTIVALSILAALALPACKKKPPEKITATAVDDAGAPHWTELLGLGRGSRDPGRSPGPFSSYGKCIAEVERRLPPELGVVLPEHYDVPDAICRMRQALAEDNPGLCKKGHSYSLRKGCETAYAIYRKKPDACPLSYSSRQGREAECLALAMRSPVLCLGARYEEREVACRAILEGSVDDCRGLSLSSRERCETEVRRWKPLVQGDAIRGSFPKGFEPSLQLTLTSAGGSPVPAGQLNVDCAGAGAVAPSHGDDEQIVLCEMYSYRYRSGQRSSSSYASRVRLDLSFRPPRQPGAAIPFGPDARFRMRLTGGGIYESTGQGSVTVTRFERQRGGRITGSFKVTVVGTSRRLAAAEELTVQGTFDTFVRDLVDPLKLRRGSRYRSGYGYGYGSRYGSGSSGGLGSPGGSGRGSGSGSGAGAAGLLGTLRGLRTNPYGSGSVERTKRFAAVLTAATLTEVTVGARKGLQVTSMVKGSLWERMGVLEGDVVYQIGSVRLLRRADAVRIRSELRAAKDRIAVSLRRGKRNTTLTLTRPAIEDIRGEFTL